MAILVPAMLRARANGPLSSAERFRRRRLLAFLLMCAVGSAVYALVSGGGAWEAHAGIDAALVLYVGFLLETGRRRIERSAKVRPIELQKRGSRASGRRAAAAEDFGFYEPMAAGDRRS